jgi:predicted nuclease of restriction endonuclease-like (RecB) superfamily
VNLQHITKTPTLPGNYADFVRDIKTQIARAQTRAALAVNSELVLLYWHIGKSILEQQDKYGWGGKIIEQLSKDLKQEFPEMKGFSPRNLKYMRAFAAAWPEISIVQQLAAQLPWFHNCVLIDKVKNDNDREWYARATIEHGWSRNVLVHQIESDLHLRAEKAISNFERTLPAPQSELARQMLKDPYNFDFLTLGDAAHERDLEQGLLEHIRQFMLELGVGFAFVGSQYHLEVGSDDFYIDLLFYHLHLRCFVVVDLKMKDFQPEFAGKMNFYLSAVDDLLRHSGDSPSIGLILCKSKTNKIIAEYALRDMNKPIGVSAYQISQALPEEFQGSLPTIEQLEAELANSP